MEPCVVNPAMVPGSRLPRSGWGERCLAILRRITARVIILQRRPARRLRICETLSLGEKRFVAVIRFERQQFLVGGTSNSVAVLARLGQAPLDDVRHDEKVSSR